MRRITMMFLCFCTCYSACKKDKGVDVKMFKGISEMEGGKVIPLFEFSSADKPQNILYNALLAYGTGTIRIKIKYQLKYKGNILASANIESGGSPVTVDYTTNTKGLVTGANFYGKRNNVSYDYDNEDKLMSNIGGGTISTYVYDTRSNLEKIILKTPQGIKLVEILVTTDELTNPLKRIPLVYLEEDMPMWTWFSLSKHNITSLTYTYFDSLGNITETVKYVYSYSYDEQGNPIKMKRYTFTEYLKGDKGYYEQFTYNYE